MCLSVVSGIPVRKNIFLYYHAMSGAMGTPYQIPNVFFCTAVLPAVLPKRLQLGVQDATHTESQQGGSIPRCHFPVSVPRLLLQDAHAPSLSTTKAGSADSVAANDPNVTVLLDSILSLLNHECDQKDSGRSGVHCLNLSV